MERRRQGPGGPRPLGVEVEVARASGETDDELVDEVTRAVFEAIERDADGGPWLGRVMLHNDNAAKKSEQLLETIDLRVDENDSTPSREFEVTAIIATTGKFIEGMCKQVVAILSATAGERQAVADLVGRVAKYEGQMSKAAAKLQYKTTREEQETERLRVKELGRTKRSETRWNNFGSAAEEYHDVVAKWSDYLLEEVKRGEKVSPPTVEDVDAVFAGEEFDSLRALAREMLATPDRAARMEIAASFKTAIAALSESQQAMLKLRALQQLKSEARAREAFKWLANPRSNPTK